MEEITLNEKVIKWGLLLLLVLTPLIFLSNGYRSYDVIKIATAGVIVLFLILVWLARMNEEDDFRLPKNPLNLAVGIFYLVAMLSLLCTTNLHEGVRGLGELSIYIFVFLLVASHIKQERTIIFIFDLIITCAFLASSYDLWVNQGIDFTTPRDVHLSSFGHPNFAAQYLVIAIPLAISRFLMSPELFKKFLYLISLLTMILFLLLSKTRGAWLALAISLTFMCILISLEQRKKGRKIIIFSKAVAVAVICAIFILCFIMFLPPHGLLGKGHPLLLRAISTFNFHDYSVKVRLNLWQDVFKMALAHPILGWGIGNFAVVHPLFRTLAERQATGAGIIFAEAHNEFLHTWVELGIFGLLAFIWILLVALVIAAKLMWSKAKEPVNGLVAIAILTVLVGTIVHAIFSSNFQVPATALTIWVMMGILASKYNQTFIQEDVARPKVRNRLRYFGVWGLAIGMLFVLLPFFINPLISDYHLLRGIDQNLENRFSDALASFNHALKFAPKDIRANFEKGENLRKLRRFDEAMVSFQAAREFFPYYEPIYNNLGICYAEQKNYPEAERLFVKAVEINPRSYSSHLNLAWLYHLTGRTKKAEEQFIQAFQLEKKWLVSVYPQLNTIYKKEGLYEKFLAEAKAEYYFQKAIENHHLGRSEEAIKNFNLAIEVNPYFTEAYIWLIPKYVYAKEDWQNDSLDPIAMAIDLKLNIAGIYPKEKWVYLIEGFGDVQQGKDEQAKKKFTQALAIDPNFKWAYYELGRVYVRQQDKSLAKKIFRKALRCDPENNNYFPNNEIVLEEIRRLK